MPPHGRRLFLTLTVVLSLLFLLTSTASAASAVLGIDLGTEYIKAALVKPGIPLEIVLTKDSKRKEAAAVALKPTKSSSESKILERLYGGDAIALSARFPGDVYTNLKPLLGRQFADPEVKTQYGVRYPGLHMVEGEGTGKVAFLSESYGKEEKPFLVEELLGMELKNIKANAQALAGKSATIRDVVITIPAFYTAEERRAVKLAAEFADLRVLNLISDGLAIGLNYAVSRAFPAVNEGGKPEYHLVYDMGAGSTTATLLKFQGRTVKDIGRFNKTIQEVQVMGTAWDKTLGGDALNAVIVDDLVDQFAATFKMKALGAGLSHIKADGRTMAKLWKEAERLRQVLSANTETSASFEGLYYGDVNFKYKLNRLDFERLTSEYVSRVQGPMTRALSSAKLSLADIESVILHGGTVRTPFVQKSLEAAVKDSEKIKTNVNSDEAAVMGAAFKAAGISPSFRVKEIRTYDNAAYAVGFGWDADTKPKQQKLFVPTSQVGTEKQVQLKLTEDTTFSLYQQIPQSTGDLLDSPVLTVKTQNLTASVKKLVDKFECAQSDISTKLSIHLSSVDGIPEVIEASVSCEVAGNKGGVVDGVKDFFGFGSKKGDQVPLKGAIEDSETSTSLPKTETSTTAESKSSASSVEAGLQSDEKANAKKRIESITIDFVSKVAGLPQVTLAELQCIHDRLEEFDASDRSRLLREETLNILEGFTYKIRDLLTDDGFIAASTDKERTEIESKSEDASEWLYGDGVDASRDTLKARLNELRGLVDPIQKRKDEAVKRPGEVKALKEALDSTQKMVSVLKEQSEKASSAAEAASSSTPSAGASTTFTKSSADDFGDLEDETSSSTTASATPKAPMLPMYSPEDIAEITESFESVQKWLDNKVAEQDKLSTTDDPVLLSSDMAAKSKELNAVVMKLLQKQMKPPPKPKSSSKAKTSKTKTSKKGKKTTTPSPEDIGKEMPGATVLKPGASQEEIDEVLAQAMKGFEGSNGRKEAKASGKGKSNIKDEL